LAGSALRAAWIFVHFLTAFVEGAVVLALIAEIEGQFALLFRHGAQGGSLFLHEAAFLGEDGALGAQVVLRHFADQGVFDDVGWLIVGDQGIGVGGEVFLTFARTDPEGAAGEAVLYVVLG
jgi:hypothetical protein